MNYYKILQVDSEAEPEVIAAAYKRLALKYHPDTNESPDAMNRMKEINIAYKILSDPHKRKLYDDNLRKEKLDSTKYKDRKINNDYTYKQNWNTSAYHQNKELLYRSNFYSDFWLVERGTDYEYYHENGYYYIKLNSQNRYQYSYKRFNCDNFIVNVDAQIERYAGLVGYGIIFSITEDYRGNDFYWYEVTSQCNYALYICKNETFMPILDYRFSNHIFEASRVNSLFIEKKNENITLGVNGEILSTIKDYRLQGGSIGLFVSTPQSNYINVRFRDFKLYSLNL